MELHRVHGIQHVGSTHSIQHIGRAHGLEHMGRAWALKKGWSTDFTFLVSLEQRELEEDLNVGQIKRCQIF